jgi:serine O-acetyltransferase
MSEFEDKINGIVEKLCKEDSYRIVYHHPSKNLSMPSVEKLGEFVELCRCVLFPGYFGNSELQPQTMKYYLGSNIDKIFRLLGEQIMRGFCFEQGEDEEWLTAECNVCNLKARELALKFIDKLPEIRRLLSTDVEAAYEGDPAAKSYGETIFCYPSITVLTNHRIAHELLNLGAPLIPRIISEMAHSKTGIDIHPGAQIGEKFFIDHGTGVVIGETCVIGKNVRLYQGVTLGAKSFPLDENGNPIKGIPRHPVVEDNVIIYSGATVLGRVTIGRNSVIGGNVWLTYDVPPNSKLMQTRAVHSKFEHGAGI